MFKILLMVITIINQSMQAGELSQQGQFIENFIKLVINKSNKYRTYESSKLTIDESLESINIFYQQNNLTLPTLRFSTNFIAQIFTIIFQEQDITLQTDNFKPFLEEFEIDLNTDTMRTIFKKQFDQKTPIDFIFHFNTPLHVKLNTKKCLRDKFDMTPNTNTDPRPLSCLVIPFYIELFGHKYLSLLKVEFYLLRTVSYSRFVLTNLYFDFYDDLTGDTLIKADKLKDFVNDTLYYAVGSINFGFSQNYENLIDRFDGYCHQLNVKQDDEEYYVACY